mmetsp:Transcript_9913/g.22879  ORF Transcript_9913/g.22879 Transcript_9913/m.22879 type:complete len:191 (-) Transcript_9913:101-673(-)
MFLLLPPSCPSRKKTTVQICHSRNVGPLAGETEPETEPPLVLIGIVTGCVSSKRADAFTYFPLQLFGAVLCCAVLLSDKANSTKEKQKGRTIAIKIPFLKNLATYRSIFIGDGACARQPNRCWYINLSSRQDFRYPSVFGVICCDTLGMLSTSDTHTLALLPVARHQTRETHKKCPVESTPCTSIKRIRQ